MMVNDFISVAIQSPQSVHNPQQCPHNQRGKSAQGSKVCTERNAIQWRPNVHLSEMQSKTIQCIFDSCVTVLIWTLSDVFHLNTKMHFLWSLSIMAGQGVIGVFGHSRWRCISMSTRMYICTSHGQYGVSGSPSPARVPLENIFQSNVFLWIAKFVFPMASEQCVAECQWSWAGRRQEAAAGALECLQISYIHLHTHRYLYNWRGSIKTSPTDHKENYY